MSTKFQLIECTDCKNHWRERVLCEMCRDENIRNKDNEKDNGVWLCSPRVSHSLQVFLRHRQRLRTHNSAWFRAVIERSGIISSIICRKVWPDWIRGTLTFAARLVFFPSSKSVHLVLLRSAVQSWFNVLNEHLIVSSKIWRHQNTLM